MQSKTPQGFDNQGEPPVATIAIQIYLHLVFSTKHRQPFLQEDSLRAKLFAYLAGTCTELKCHSLQVGGWHDHVHILCSLSRTLSISELIRELKRSSSEWVKANSTIPGFYWQTGYGAFSVSPGHAAALVDYIKNQAKHHRTVTFQEEYRRLCEKYGLEIDERYCWD